MIKTKKSQSEVISAVLMILLVIVAIGIIVAFVVPFVRNQLNGTGCFDVMDKIEITTNPQYSCYNTSASNMSVQVHVGDIRDKIKGFTIVLGGASSKSYSVVNGQTSPNVFLYNGSNLLKIPDANTEETYTISGVPKPDSVQIHAILIDGKNCEASPGLDSVTGCFTF